MSKIVIVVNGTRDEMSFTSFDGVNFYTIINSQQQSEISHIAVFISMYAVDVIAICRTAVYNDVYVMQRSRLTEYIRIDVRTSVIQHDVRVIDWSSIH